MNILTRLLVVCLVGTAGSASAEMDDARLKDWLSGNFIAPESMEWEERSDFKLSHAIPDEQLHRVLMDIYNEASGKWNSLTPKTVEWNKNRRTVEGVLGWLPVCGDIPVKSFLMDYAVSKENDYLTRSDAVLSYLRLADAEESKNALLRFLVEENRMDGKSRLIIYGHARTVYDVASPEKKAAILAALLASANREEGKIEFMKIDKILAERSAAYRYSRERLVMLERHSLEPPTNNLYTDRDLKAGLEECRKYKTHTNISTNLAALKTRNFNLPLPAGTTNELTDPVPAPSEVEFVKIGDESDDPIPMKVIAIVIILAIIGFSVWKTKRK
jgi:hypothetical protein